MHRTDHCAPCHISASGILATLRNAQNYYSFLIQHKYLWGGQSNELLETHYTTSAAAFYASYVCTNITKPIYCRLPFILPSEECDSDSHAGIVKKPLRLMF